MSLHLEPGEAVYVGYHEWVVHPDEAAVILDRGYILLNGRQFACRHIADLNGYPQIRVEGIPGDASDPRDPWGELNQAAQAAEQPPKEDHEVTVPTVPAHVGYIHPTASIGGPPEHRKYIWKWYRGDYAQNAPAFFPPKIAETAIVHEFCTINGGTYHQTTVGDRTFLMARVHVGHDVVIGDDCEIGAGVVICGEVTIGNNVQIGGNTWIKPQVTIGDGARVGGGAVVVRDIPAGEVWAGNPAKPLRKGREAEARGQAVTDGEAVYVDGRLVGWQFPEGKHGTERQVSYDTHDHYDGFRP